MRGIGVSENLNSQRFETASTIFERKKALFNFGTETKGSVSLCTVFCVPLWYVRKKRTFYPFVDYRWELVSHQIPQTLQKCPLLSKHPRLRKPRAKRKKIEKWYFVTEIVLTSCEEQKLF